MSDHTARVRRAWYSSPSYLGGPYYLRGKPNADGTTTYSYVELVADQWAQWRQRTHFGLVG